MATSTRKSRTEVQRGSIQNPAWAPQKNRGGRQKRPVSRWGAKVAMMANRTGMSYSEMARICGVSSSAFGLWMAGVSTVPCYAVELLADAFGVSMDELRTLPKARRVAR